MGEELKNCPFCWGPPNLKESPGGTVVNASCSRCCVVMSEIGYGCRERLISKWNRRIMDPDGDEITDCPLHGHVVVNGDCPRC